MPGKKQGEKPFEVFNANISLDPFYYSGGAGAGVTVASLRVVAGLTAPLG